jgi:hypothetical protein
MTTFVIDAPVAIDLAAGGATTPPEHSLVAPTLLRSQALALVYESVHRGRVGHRGPHSLDYRDVDGRTDCRRIGRLPAGSPDASGVTAS